MLFISLMMFHKRKCVRKCRNSQHNAKNTNAANIFVNKLHGLVSEYAEVNHTNVCVHHMFSRILQLQKPFHVVGMIFSDVILGRKFVMIFR